MKTIIFLKTAAAVIITAFLLSACGSFGDRGFNEKRLVSAIAVRQDSEGLTLFIEAVKAEEKGKVSPKLLKGRGENISSAMNKIESDSPEPLGFGHTAIILLERNASKSVRDEFFGYLTEKKEIPLSVRVASGENVEKILESEGDSGESVGYELSSVLENSSEKLGIAAHTTLYEIQTARQREAGVYALPEIEITDNGRVMEGMSVFVEDTFSCSLDYPESVTYSILRNTFEGGEIRYRDGAFSVRSATSDITAAVDSGRLYITVKIKAEKRGEELAETVSKTLHSFKNDIFGFKERLKAEYPEVYSRIEDSYYEYFKNAEIKVVAE